MWWFRDSLRIRWRHAPSADRCSIWGLYFWWFRRDCLHVTPYASSTIPHSIEIFHVVLSKLTAGASDVLQRRVYAVPYDITPSHFTQRYTVCMYAVPFDITLSHFTQRYTICVYAVPFDITLSYFTLRYTVCAYAVLLDITLSHLTQRYTVCVLYCKWVLSYSILS